MMDMLAKAAAAMLGGSGAQSNAGAGAVSMAVCGSLAAQLVFLTSIQECSI